MYRPDVGWYAVRLVPIRPAVAPDELVGAWQLQEWQPLTGGRVDQGDNATWHLLVVAQAENAVARADQLNAPDAPPQLPAAPGG